MHARFRPKIFLSTKTTRIKVTEMKTTIRMMKTSKVPCEEGSSGGKKEITHKSKKKIDFKTGTR